LQWVFQARSGWFVHTQEADVVAAAQRKARRRRVPQDVFGRTYAEKSKTPSELVDKVLVRSEELPCWMVTSNKKEGLEYETGKYV
jgi:hypothetical protein